MEKNMQERNQRMGEIEDDTAAKSPTSGEDAHEHLLKKKMKFETNGTLPAVNMAFNENYLSSAFMEKLQTKWHSPRGTSDFKDAETDTKVFTDPFQLCLLPEFLQEKSNCQQLVNEMVEKVQWSRKQMDLYEFYQSMDISNLEDCEMLTTFLQILRRNVRPWMEKVTNLKLDYVSVSCSMYTCGDYLLVHDDLLKDRQVAFVYYLSPWDGMAEWSNKHGGCLEIFNSDENCLPQFPVNRKISPKNNQFAFFKVGARSFHQVGEVTNFDYPRLTINGWFHGPTNEECTDVPRPLKLHFMPPHTNSVELANFINDIYLRMQIKKNIQTRIEENSEICLYSFLKSKIFDEALNELHSDTNLKWRQQGPANAHNYQILDMESAGKAITQLHVLFTSAQMFGLLREITDLDLSGETVSNPTCCFELQRWSHGNYTVLGDDAMCGENTLDLIYYLNATDGVGEITYLSPEEEEEPTSAGHIDDKDDDNDSVLLTITPVDNALSIVYRCENTTRFTKYVSRNIPLENGPVFMLCCSYKE